MLVFKNSRQQKSRSHQTLFLLIQKVLKKHKNKIQDTNLG